VTQLDDPLLAAIARDQGTPCYVLNLDLVRERVREVRLVFGPDALLHYAVKANALGALLRALRRLGVRAETVSGGEIERALNAGFAPEQVVFNGPGKTGDEIERAVELGLGLVVLDDPAEVERWAVAVRRQGRGRVRALVRVNPGLDPGTHPHLATGQATSKFGMPPERVGDLARACPPEVQLEGVHVHAGSQIESAELLAEVLSRVEPAVRSLPSATLIDIGGGWAVPYGPGEPRTDLASLAGIASDFARRLNLRLALEPGRYLVAEAGVLLTKVVAVKPGPPLGHVICDAGMTELLRPALYGARHPIWVVGRSGEPTAWEVDGPNCENADRLGSSIPLPRLQPGDLLVVGVAGAYGSAMASNYCSRFLPAEVVVEDSRPRLARRRQTLSDLLAAEVL